MFSLNLVLLLSTKTKQIIVQLNYGFTDNFGKVTHTNLH